MAWSVDRLGRGASQDLVGFLSEPHAMGIDLFLHQQGLDTTTPAGKAMFQMMGVRMPWLVTASRKSPTPTRAASHRS